MERPTLRDSDAAFADAIAADVLSEDPSAPHFAGNYMYMGTYGCPGCEARDGFEHRQTRGYTWHHRAVAVR